MGGGVGALPPFPAPPGAGAAGACAREIGTNSTRATVTRKGSGFMWVSTLTNTAPGNQRQPVFPAAEAPKGEREPSTRQGVGRCGRDARAPSGPGANEVDF